jgi:hypothetical protein
MQIIFRRTGLRSYATLAVRDDRVAVSIPSFDRPTSLPHDVAHFVVERELGLARGFWGCVADGAIFPGMTVVSGRQSARAAERSRSVIRDAGQRGTEAEVLVGTMLRIAEAHLDATWPVAREILRDMWAPAGPSHTPLTADEVRRICDALRDAGRRWHALPVGESMQVTWPALRRWRGRGRR